MPPRRSAYAFERALVRRGDDGSNEFNSSAVAGRAAAAVLTLAYYPQSAATAAWCCEPSVSPSSRMPAATGSLNSCPI